MYRPMSDFHFRFMAFGFKFRDIFAPRASILKKVGIETGSSVLDFGCGPGGYVAAAARLAGESGKVYALDIHPLAIKAVQRMVSRKQLENVEAVLSECETGLPDNSVDVVLFYDTFHSLDEPEAVLRELYRVLNPGGVLSFSDHHMKEEEAVSAVTSGGLFNFSRKDGKTYRFTTEA
jgi:ubiquinone/menaquinone biosynthesis C-methylase UbiE